jgi:DNA-binding winged helix-turn-helix (wHTH) protein
MERPAKNPTTLCFGLFEADLQTRELRKSGVKIKLNEQPFQVLALLLERPGEVITREELQTRLWPADTFVDFDVSLNGAVKKLRQALGDESDNPRFIETLYRRGYRFIAPVSVPGSERTAPGGRENGDPAVSSPALRSDSHAGNGAGSQHVDSVGAPVARSRKRWAYVAAGCVGVLLAGLSLARMPKSSPRILGFTQLTSGGKVHQLAALATDGQRLYFQAVDRGRIALGQVSVTGGDSALIVTPFDNTYLGDIAPDGSSLLISNFAGTEKLGPLWVLPLPAGPPRPLGTMAAYSAAWSPDGRRLLFADGADLYEANPDGSGTRKLATLSARIGEVRISPDGQKIRATLYDLKTGFGEFWELNRDGNHPHRLLPNWNDSPHDCCGQWTPDGRYFLFTSLREGRNSRWALPER